MIIGGRATHAAKAFLIQGHLSVCSTDTRAEQDVFIEDEFINGILTISGSSRKQIIVFQ